MILDSLPPKEIYEIIHETQLWVSMPNNMLYFYDKYKTILCHLNI